MSEIAAVPESHQDLLDSTALAHLSSLGPDGEPQVHPVWFGLEGDRIVVSTTKARQKYRNLQRDRRVAMTIVDPANDYRYLEVRGVVTEMEDDPDGELIDELARKYQGVDRYAGKKPGDERVRIYIEALKANTMG